MKLKCGDVEFSMLDESDLMWSEADAIERVTGMTMVEIGSKGQVCGCGHRLSAHAPADNPVCTQCGCDQPASNVPSTVAQAMLWVSMKRANPELTFRQVGEMAAASFEQVDDEPDPIGADEATPAT